MSAMLALLLHVAAGSSSAACTGGVEEAFQAIQTAVEARDVAALQQRVHPRFKMLHGLGQIEGRDGWLRLVGGGKLPRQTAERREWNVETAVIGDTGLRTSIVRFRDARLKRDMWLRGTATFVCYGGQWRQLWQQSTLLSDAPSSDAVDLGNFVGDYSIPGRDGFKLVAEEGLLTLRWATGAALPLLPLGQDRFASGPGSSVQFTRDGAGRVVTMVRSGPEGPWWTATRR